MNLDSLSFTLSQISYLVASLSKKKYSQVIEDLTKVSKKVFIFTIKKTSESLENVKMELEHPPYLYICNKTNIEQIEI